MSKKFFIKLIFILVVFVGGLFLFFWLRPHNQLKAAKDLLKRSTFEYNDTTQTLAAPQEGYFKALEVLDGLSTNLFVGDKAYNSINLSLSNGSNTFVDHYASKVSSLRDSALSNIRNDLDSLKRQQQSAYPIDWFYEQKKHYADMLRDAAKPLDSTAIAVLKQLAKQQNFEQLCLQWKPFADYALAKKDSTVHQLCSCDPILLRAQDVRLNNFTIFRPK